MEPTLHDGDRVFMSGNLDELNRGDIVVLYYPLDHKKSFVKRIVVLPGERIELRQGKVVINGKQIEESYLNMDFLSEETLGEFQIPAQDYYVMGDNRNNSSDSRLWGTVPRALIYGKYSRRYWSAK